MVGKFSGQKVRVDRQLAELSGYCTTLHKGEKNSQKNEIDEDVEKSGGICGSGVFKPLVATLSWKT